MELKIEQKINYLNSFFSYFYLNKENFSKNIQLQLKLLSPLLKFEKNLLSSIEREKLIFIQNENINKILNYGKEENEDNSINLKNLDILISIMKKFNMDLKYNKEKLSNKYQLNENEFEKELKNANFDMLLKIFNEKFDILKDNKQKKEILNEVSNDDLDKNKKFVEEKKKEIEEIEKKNEELDLEILNLKKQLNNYKDLPTEIDRMRTLVDIKKEEYKSLMIDKKVKNFNI